MHIRFGILFFLFIFCLKAVSQVDEKFRGGLELFYPYYHISSNTINRFNFGTSLMIEKKIEKIRLGLSFSKSSEDYFFDTEPVLANEYLIKRSYYIDRIDMCIYFKFHGNVDRTINIYPVVGILFSKVYNAKILSEYMFNDNRIFTIDVDKLSISNSVHLGCSVSKRISSNICLNLKPYFNYKFLFETRNSRNNFNEIARDRIVTGLSFGMEYIF